MDFLSLPQPPPRSTAAPPPRIWKFWGTALWGLFIFAGMFVGQAVVIGLLRVAARFVGSCGGDPCRRRRADDLAVRDHGNAGGARSQPGSRRGPRARHLSTISRCAGPVAEFPDWRRLTGRAGRRLGPAVACARARGDAGLYGRRAEIGAGRWRAVAARDRVLRRCTDLGGNYGARLSLPRLVEFAASRVPGAIFLSSLVWTSMHLQYSWFFFGEVFTIGLLLGYFRYRTGSTWLTIVLHGLNNTAATIQTFWLAGQSLFDAFSSREPVSTSLKTL